MRFANYQLGVVALLPALAVAAGGGCSKNNDVSSEPIICAAGEYSCQVRTLRICNDSMTGWIEVNVCGEGTRCDVLNKSCVADSDAGGTGGAAGGAGSGGSAGTAGEAGAAGAAGACIPSCNDAMCLGVPNPNACAGVPKDQYDAVVKCACTVCLEACSGAEACKNPSNWWENPAKCCTVGCVASNTPCGDCIRHTAPDGCAEVISDACD